MEYFATASGRPVRDEMDKGTLCQIVTPAAGNAVHPTVRRWCADNAVFADKYPGDERYFAWLGRRAWAADRCTFAVAPDVVGDAVATLRRSGPMFDRIRSVGFPVALALQDGAEALALPWDDFDVAFIGGSTEFKVGDVAAELASEARARGKWVHMGRVNSLKRMRRAAQMGCDSVDGTYLRHRDLERGIPEVLGWLAAVA